MNMDSHLNPCTLLHDNCTVSVPTPCDFRKVIVRASCDLYREVVKITRRLYDNLAVVVRYPQGLCKVLS